MAERVAIVGGVRTPFVKAGAQFADLTLQDLGIHVLKELILREQIKPESVDEFIFSTVLLDPRTPNWAREILFGAGLPKTVSAHSVSNNCISGLVAMSVAANNITLGRSQMAIAGGAESMSLPALLFSKRASKIFLQASRARSFGERLGLFSKLRPNDFLPNPPSPTEPSTGLTMGQHMELTAKELSIPREGQDEIALKSHLNAFKATQEGKFKDEIAPLNGVDKDAIVRGDTSLEKLAKLKPVFDKKGTGTLTAGNSSPLTDGASVILLMSESKAKAEGREIIAFLRDIEFAAIDPAKGLLMAPAVAVPRLLKRNRFTLQDFHRIEIHEAFAAQVLANVQAWEKGTFEPSIGTVPWEKVNVLGGSIALGHPFAATAGRIVLSLANELRREKLERGLVSICAAGAMAGAAIIELR
jgi:acetyl-CoA acetyltransferase family protein